MTYNYICLSCNKMMVMETWSPKSCDCGGVFVSREAVEEAYGYLTGEQDVLPLSGAELARELERVGAVLKHKEPKSTVTDVQAGIDDEELLWLTVEFNHNPSGSHKFLIGKVDTLPELPEWLKEFTGPEKDPCDEPRPIFGNPGWLRHLLGCKDAALQGHSDYRLSEDDTREWGNDSVASDVVGWVDPGAPIVLPYEEVPDWLAGLNYEEDDEEVEEVKEPKPGDCAGPRPKFGEPGWLRYTIYCSDEPVPDADIDVPWDYYEGC